MYALRFFITHPVHDGVTSVLNHDYKIRMKLTYYIHVQKVSAHSSAHWASHFYLKEEFLLYFYHSHKDT